MADAPQSIPAQLKQRDRERLAAYDDNLRFYKGDQWPARRRRNEIRRRLTLNYVKPILVKTTASLLKGRTFIVEPDDDSDAAAAAASEAELAIAQVHEQNAVDQLDFDTELDAAVLGDGVYKVWWDADFSMVRITAPDPSGIFAWHWPDDPSRVWRVAHRYQLAPADAAAILQLDQAGRDALAGAASKRTVTITEVWERETFALYVDETLDRSEPNALGAIPYVIFPNIREPKALWGLSDVDALREPQRELNRAVTQVSRIAELSGNPIAILEGVDEGGDLIAEPGEMWELPENAKAYVLDLLQHAGTFHRDHIERVMQALYDQGETPRTAFGGLTQDLSGVAIELDLDPLVKKVERKRLLRTEAYQHRTDLILATLATFGGVDYAGANHGLQWGAVLPTDRDRDVAQAVQLVAAGVHSRRTEADALGGVDDPDAEFARWLEEESQLPNPQPEGGPPRTP